MGLFKKPTEEEIFLKFIEKFRKENIPSNFNQAKGVENLINPDNDYTVSISSRTDGKSFNYMGMLMAVAWEFDLGLLFLDRHYTVRQAYMENIWEIMHVMPHFDEKELAFERSDEYVEVIYKDKTIGAITDINNSSDLKNHSHFLAKFPIMIYDEFLTIETDYVPLEEKHFERIYRSVDRNDTIPLIGFPKVFLLGNPENFASPLIAMLDLYNKLEKHPINTGKHYDNIYLEMFRNDNQNAKRNLRAFKHADTASISGEFVINNTYIANDDIRESIKVGGFNYFFIKLEEGFLKVTYNINTKKTLLAYALSSSEYDFCTQVVDKKDEVIYLNENYYKDTHLKYHERGYYYYDNAYTKSLLTRDSTLVELKIWKCVSKHATEHMDNHSERIDKVYKDMYMENTLKNLQKKFAGF